MEGDHREAAAQAQEPFRRMQRPHELAELIVHGDAQSLEDSRRRVRSAGLGPDQARREVRELACGGDGFAPTGLDDGAGDGSGAALLAVVIEYVRELGFGRAVDEVGGARAIALHAHVERAVVPEREAPLRLVELHGRDADIEDDTVRAGNPETLRDAVELAEPSGSKDEPPVSRRHERLAGCNRVRIAVYRDDAVARLGVEERPRVAAGSEGAVDERSAALRIERLQDLGQQHRDVPGGLAGRDWGRRAAPVHHRGTRDEVGDPRRRQEGGLDIGCPDARNPAPRQLLNLDPMSRDCSRAVHTSGARQRPTWGAARRAAARQARPMRRRWKRLREHVTGWAADKRTERPPGRSADGAITPR